MKRITKERANRPAGGLEEGFTLIEIMIVLGILGIVLASLYGVLITQQRSFSAQEEVSGIQRDARAAINILERDIRMAGFGVPRGTNPIAAVQNNTGPNATDTIQIRYSAGSVTFLTSDTVIQPGNNVQVDPGPPSGVTGFAVGDSVNLINLENNTLIGGFTITGVDAVASQISLDGAPAGIGLGTLVVKTFRTIAYSVVTNAGTGRRELHRNDGVVDSVLIDGVQDFQLTYGLEDGSSSAAPADLSDIRRVQVSFTAETHREVSEIGSQPKTRQLITTVPLKNVRV